MYSKLKTNITDILNGNNNILVLIITFIVFVIFSYIILNILSYFSKINEKKNNKE